MNTYALSFYVTKTVLVSPKLFWSDQIDLDLTLMIWSRPKWITFGPDQFILVVTISFWLWPNHYGQVQINLVRPKPFWTDQNCFGHIEGQGINLSFDTVEMTWSAHKLSMIATIVHQNLQLSNANIIVGYVVRFFVQNAVVFSYLEDISMSLVLSEFVTPVTKILKKIPHKCCQVLFFYLLLCHTI